jgi:tRNA-binding protein
VRVLANLQPTIEYNDFLRVDMRVGRVIRVEDFPKAKNPSYKRQVEVGPISASQLREVRTFREGDDHSIEGKPI